MLVEFLNIKHSHSHCEWYTLIKRQFCDQLLSVAYWTFALISYETVTVRDHEQLRPGHQPAGGLAQPRHYAAQHQGGGAGGEVVRWAATGGADTQLISQVIKCTLHNVHNMWTVDCGLITDVLGCNSKLQTQDQQNILVWLWMNSRQYQELVEFLCGITADP